MEIHFYESLYHIPDDKHIFSDWESTTRQIELRVNEIHTLQMCLLSTSLLYDYRVFIHQGNGISYEVTLRTPENDGFRTVRPSQNMYAMWAADVFRM